MLPQLLHDVPVLTDSELLHEFDDMPAPFIVFKVFPDGSFGKEEVADSYLVVKTL